jgi:hypothetical protein
MHGKRSSGPMCNNRGTTSSVYVSRITQEVGLNTSMVISRLLADGDQIIDCRLRVAVLLGALGLLFVKGYDQVICQILTRL